MEKFSFNKINRAVTVSLKLPENEINEVKSSLDELNFLAKTLKINIIKSFIQSKDKINANYYIGSGKLEEIKKYTDKNYTDAVLFDNDLTGVQERNLEKYLNKPIFNRTELILTIFNQRAKTNEAKLQVELANMEYMKSRLRNRWDHFSRVEGGIGLRGGEGEKQIELDRRMIQDQIDKIKSRLKKVDVQMKNRRKRRLHENIVTLVGYTNAGKTTLFNRLARTNQHAENMLFSTLDSTTRQVYLNENLTILLNDTVGFINKLPHSLVASFKSTLDEVLSSKLILHIIDYSDFNILKQISSVNKVLEEIGAQEIPVIRVFNKMDLTEKYIFDFNIDHDINDVKISALNNYGITDLKERIINYFSLKN